MSATHNGSTPEPWYNGEGTTLPREGGEMRSRKGSGQKNVLNDQQKFKFWGALKEMESELQAERLSFREVARRLSLQLQFKITENNVANAVEQGIVVWKPRPPVKKSFNAKVKEVIEGLKVRLELLEEEREGVTDLTAIDERLVPVNKRADDAAKRLGELEKQGAALAKVVFNLCGELGLTSEGKTPAPKTQTPPPKSAPPTPPPPPPTPPQAPKPAPVPTPPPKAPDTVPLHTLFEGQAAVKEEVVVNAVVSPEPDWDWNAYRQLERKLGGNSRPLLRALQQPVSDPKDSVPVNLSPALTWRSSNYNIYLVVCKHNDRWCWSVGVRHLASKDIERRCNNRKAAMRVLMKCEKMGHRYLVNAGEGAYSKMTVHGSIVLYKPLTADEITFLGRKPPTKGTSEQ